MRKAGAAAILLTQIVSVDAWAFGSDDHWTSGFGQGVAESIVTKGPGNQIYVTCDVGAERNATGITFVLNGKEPTGGWVILTFDKNTPERFPTWGERIRSDCRVCADVYEAVINKLRRHSSVHVLFENGDATSFTLRGSAKAIGHCTPDFAR